MPGSSATKSSRAFPSRGGAGPRVVLAAGRTVDSDDPGGADHFAGKLDLRWWPNVSIANSSPPIRASTSLVLLHSRARLATCTIARSRPSLRLETSQRQFEKPDRFMQIALGCSCAKTRRQKDELQLRHASQSEAEWRLGCSSSFAYEGRRRVRIVSKMIS